MQFSIEHLKFLKKLRSEEELIKKRIPFKNMINEGILLKSVNKDIKYVVPNNSPRWAIKYKFTRKKYNASESISNVINYKLNEKGLKLLKKFLGDK